jgi:hypothetical protein
MEERHSEVVDTSLDVFPSDRPSYIRLVDFDIGQVRLTDRILQACTEHALKEFETNLDRESQRNPVISNICGRTFFTAVSACSSSFFKTLKTSNRYFLVEKKLI